MALTINTNLSSLIVQSNLQKSTKGLNDAIERMTTGYKINHAKDNAANYGISVNMETKMRAYQVAEDNVAMGLDLLSTKSDTLELMSAHYTRIRDLLEQAANGTYGDDSIAAIREEIFARMEECDSIMNGAEYNGILLFFDKQTSKSAEVTMQIGIDSSASSKVTMAGTSISEIFALQYGNIYDLTWLRQFTNALSCVDDVLNIISTEQTSIGALQNRLESAAEQISVAYENLASSHSTIKDSDVAKESSAYIKNQILQQASATLLATANQSPSLALQLL